MERRTNIVTRDQVRQVARLARLELSDEELDLYTDQLAAIVAYVAQLAECPVETVSGTDDATMSLRADDPRPSTERERLLGQAPDHDDEHFVVPRVIDG